MLSCTSRTATLPVFGVLVLWLAAENLDLSLSPDGNEFASFTPSIGSALSVLEFVVVPTLDKA